MESKIKLETKPYRDEEMQRRKDREITRRREHQKTLYRTPGNDATLRSSFCEHTPVLLIICQYIPRPAPPTTFRAESLKPDTY